MRIHRLLLPALLMPLFVVSLAAQSSPAKADLSQPQSQPQLDGLVAPPEFKAHVLPLAVLPPLSSDVRVRLRGIHSEASFDDTLTENDSVCYSIRSYRVTRDDPGSDSTRFAGYSECQTAGRFQMRTAVDSREIAPR